MKNAKLRIIFIVTQAEWGGAQNYVYKAAQEALRRGYDVLVAAGGEGALEIRCKERDIPYQKLKKIERNINPFAELSGLFELISVIRRSKPDVVFTFSAKAGVLGSLAARLCGVKRVVYRIGGWSWLDPVSNIQKKIRIWSERLSAPLKDIIIVQYPGDKEEAERRHIKPRKETVVISNGLDLDAFDRSLLPRDEVRKMLMKFGDGGQETTANTSPFSTPHSPLILSIANFYATKDIPNLLHAAAIVTQKRPDVRFVNIGNKGDDKKHVLRLYEELNLKQHVTFPTLSEGETNASAFLTGADVFVLSSAKEGNPWVLHEAMAAHVPCITTDVGACSWLLQNNAGWIVPPKDPEALAKAILYALDHPEEAKQRAERARRNLETLFTEKSMWEKTFEVLEN
jgi:glycosyltransferase involved in cell wall biosynthesis